MGSGFSDHASSLAHLCCLTACCLYQFAWLKGTCIRTKLVPLLKREEEINAHMHTLLEE